MSSDSLCVENCWINYLINTFCPDSADRYCDSDATVNGYEIEKGSILMVPIYAVHHDPDVWEDPKEFKPER